MTNADAGAGGQRRSLSIAKVQAVVTGLERRAERVLDPASAPKVGDLESLLTDASAWRLTLDAERVRVERRMASAPEGPGERGPDPQLQDLARRHQLLTGELHRLVDLMADLRVRLDRARAKRPT